MSKVNKFARSSLGLATDEDFNLIFWISYAVLVLCILSLMPLVVFPPVAVVFIVLVAAPVLFYTALWAVVGVANLINYIEKKIVGASSVHYSFVENPTVSPEPGEAPKYQDAASSVVVGPEFTASAAQYSDPLSAQTYTDPQPVQYGQPVYPQL